MNYELAKKLKDAGLKQDGEGRHLPFTKPVRVKFHTKKGNLLKVWGKKYGGEQVYIPTLEELIVACGDRFGSLDSLGDLGGNGSISEWSATNGDKNGFLSNTKLLTGRGKTPLEAVANLYIKLKENVSTPRPS